MTLIRLRRTWIKMLLEWKSNSINLKNQKIKQERERRRGREKLNIFLTNNFKSCTCQELLKINLWQWKISDRNENYDFGFFISLLSPMSFRSNYSTAWEMRWLFCNVKIFTWLKSFTYRNCFLHCQQERIKSRATKILHHSRSNRISNLTMMFEINASSRSIFEEKLSSFDNLDRRFMRFEICIEAAVNSIKLFLYVLNFL
jgi:hypothetical protein